MARTKADSTRKAGGKAPRKSSGGRPSPYPVTTRSASKTKKTSLNPVVQRPTPEWQKPITNFFPSDEGKNEAGPSAKDISEASTSRGVENTDPNSDKQAVEEEADSEIEVEDSDVSMENSTLLNDDEVAENDQNLENSNKTTDVFNVTKEDSSVDSCYEEIHENDVNSSEKSLNKTSSDFQTIKCEADCDIGNEASDISLETSTSTVANEDVADNYPLPMAPDEINDFQVIKCDADSDIKDEVSDISLDTSTSTLVNEDVADNYPLPVAQNEIIDLTELSEEDKRSVNGSEEGIDEVVGKPIAKNSVDLVETAASLISDAKKQTKESATSIIKETFSSLKGEGENCVIDGEYVANNTEGELEFIVTKPGVSTYDGMVCLDKPVKPPSAASPISTRIKDD